MNKFLKMAAAALFAAFLVLPGMSRADAAMKLAVVPLIIGENVEDDAGLSPLPTVRKFRNSSSIRNTTLLIPIP